MTRMTNDIAKEIATKITDKKFKKTIDKMMFEAKEMIHDWIKENKILLDSVPEKYREFTRYAFEVYVGGYRYGPEETYTCTKDGVTIRWVKNERFVIKLPQNRKFLSKNSYYYISEGDGDFNNKILEFTDTIRRKINERNSFFEKCNAQIRAHTTIKKLIDSLPEIEKFVPRVNNKKNLPVAKLDADIVDVVTSEKKEGVK